MPLRENNQRRGGGTLPEATRGYCQQQEVAEVVFYCVFYFFHSANQMFCLLKLDP